MKKSRLLGAVCACLLPFISNTASSALYGRLPDYIFSNGVYQAVYDSDLDITWLANANYAMTSGYDSDGFMTYSQSVAWVQQLVFGGHSDWRLPTTPLLDVGCSRPQQGFDEGWNCTLGEMEHLFYVELGGISQNPIGGSTDPDLDLFFNLPDRRHRYGTELDFNTAFTFDFRDGWKGIDNKEHDLMAAWAVADGDVFASTVPIPPALWLFGSGLLSLIGISRRRMS